MSTTIAGDKSLSLTSDESTVTETVENFVESTDAPESVAEPFVALVDGLANELEETHKELAVAHKRIDDLEEELADVEEIGETVEDHTQRLDGFSSWLDSVNDRVAVVEDDVTDETPTPDAPETPLHDTIETSLEQIAALPEHIADGELTSNQQRARFIAKDIRDYSSKAPAGRVVKSSELRKVLAARDNSNPHTETVSRVMDFLKDFGEGEVRVVKRRGEKRVVFEESIVERLQEIGDETITPAVIGDTVSV